MSVSNGSRGLIRIPVDCLCFATCAVEQETDCCMRFGITADLPSVTEAATTD